MTAIATGAGTWDHRLAPLALAAVVALAGTGHASPQRPAAVRKAAPPGAKPAARTGTIQGTLLDGDGKPVSGAVVRTRHNKANDNVPAHGFNAPPEPPDVVTEKAAVSDAQGRFRLDGLRPAKYQIVIKHREFLALIMKDNDVKAAKTTPLSVVTLTRGTAIHGNLLVAGKPGANAKVFVSPVADKGNTAPAPLMIEATTDEHGKFELGQAVPPGRYQVIGARFEPNPLVAIRDYHESKQVVTVKAGEEELKVTVEIPK